MLKRFKEKLNKLIAKMDYLIYINIEMSQTLKNWFSNTIME